MTVAHDGHDLTPASVNEKVAQLFTKFVTLAAPRLFALCREYCKDDEGWVFSWGAAFDHIAVLFSPSGKITGTFNSANSALNLFSRSEDLRLVWVDPTVYNQSGTITA
jgi:hypothetical protein